VVVSAHEDIALGTDSDSTRITHLGDWLVRIDFFAENLVMFH